MSSLKFSNKVGQEVENLVFFTNVRTLLLSSST